MQHLLNYPVVVCTLHDLLHMPKPKLVIIAHKFI